jgi:hypothetical protein
MGMDPKTCDAATLDMLREKYYGRNDTQEQKDAKAAAKYKNT